MSHTLSPYRAACQHRAATILQDAQKVHAKRSANCTDAGIARRWGQPAVGNEPAKPLAESYVARLFDPESGKAATLRDVIALPPELARDVLLRALASLEDAEAQSPEETLGDIVIKAGELTGVLRADRIKDGVLNEFEAHRDHFAALATVAIRGYLAADGRAAKGGGK
jgi:hypothetical protein